MYSNIAHIKKHQLKINLDDEQHKECMEAAEESGRQPSTLGREALLIIMKYRLWEHANIKRLERALEDTQNTQKAA